VLAAASLAIDLSLGGVVPIWIPAGAAVAVFGLVPRAKWPAGCLVLGLTAFLVVLASGMPPHWSALFAFATLAEGMICAAIGMRVLQGNVRRPEGARKVAGLFGAAALSSTIFAVATIPIDTVPDLETTAIRLLGHMLGIVIVSSLVLHVRENLMHKEDGANRLLSMELAWTLAFVAALAIVLMRSSTNELSLVMLAGMVLLSVRLIAPVPALSVLVVSAIGTLVSLNGNSPLPNLEADPASALLQLQIWLFLILATSIPVAAMLFKRDTMAEQLADQNALLAENVTIFGLAEELAGIGRWQVDLASGRQEFSSVMSSLLGVAPLGANERGDIRDLLQAGGDAIFDELDRNCRENDLYSFNCRIKPVDGPERILRFSARNDFGPAGVRKAVFAVAMDVTGQVRREEALDLARGRAVRLAAEAQKLANTDVLTELPNRRCSFALLERHVAQARRDGSELSLLLFDIDHFKKVNDTFGHKAGDDVLLRVAHLARREMRGGDMVGRIGGEEFVCLMPGVGASDARKLAERLRRAIAAESAGDGLPAITVSVGVACLRAGDDAGSLLARTDEALYVAKEGGRNTVRRVA